MDGEYENSYDFDAPMFVDFTNRGQCDQDDSDIDKWFDERDGDDGGIMSDSLEEDNNEENNVKQPKNNEQKVLTEAEEEHTQDNKSATIELSSQKSKEGPKSEPMFFFEDKSAPNLTVAPSWKPRLQALRQVVATSASAKEDEPPMKKKRADPARSQVNTSTKSSCGPRRALRSSARSEAKKTARAKQMPKLKAPILTIPSTPTMMKRAKNVPSTALAAIKPKEEMELEQIAQMQKELKEKRKQNEEFMKKALSAGNFVQHRSVDDNLTQAHEFHFELDKRIKKPQLTPGGGKEKSFLETLRQHPISPSFKNRKPTKQQPFSFDSSHSRKRKAMDEVNSCDGYVSMAQQCYKFQYSTPPRFRIKNTKEQNIGPPQDNEKHHTKLTCPKTPCLTTKERKRVLPDDCLSREQQEEKELEEMKKYKFKAREFDPKIVQYQGMYGVQKRPEKNLTEFKPFKLASEERSIAHKEKESSEVEEKPAPFKAQPVPEFDKKVFKPDLTHQVTKQQPFSFEQRDKEMQVKKEEKIQSIIEEEKKAREFHAQPLQSFSPVELPSISKPITKVEPFNLSADTKGARKAELWAKKVEEEMQEQRKKAVFKAHSSNVLYQAPFVPKKSLKPNTIFDEFNLNSERRAEERAEYEIHKREREIQDQELIQQRQAEREEEEKQNIAVLRKQLVHKANPIRTYKPVAIAASDKQLTKPESPSWHTRDRKVIRI